MNTNTQATKTYRSRVDLIDACNRHQTSRRYSVSDFVLLHLKLGQAARVITLRAAQHYTLIN